MAHEVNQSERDVAAQVRWALVQSIGSERMELWIPPDTTWNFQHGVLTLAFSSEFACQLCRKVLRTEIGRALLETVGGANHEIQFVVRAELPMNQQLPKPENGAVRSASSDRTVRSSSGIKLNVIGVDSLDNDLPADVPIDAHPRKLTHSGRRSEPVDLLNTESPNTVAVTEGEASQSLWSKIVSGESNQLACAAIKMVISEPGRTTPVLLHGPTGTGKSLLLSALAQRMRAGLRMRRVVYMTAEQFTNDFTEGLQGGGLPMFRRKYRDVDALLLDDIQFLMGKRSTLNEVRHTVDNLLRSGKQVVLSADRSLNELAALGEEFAGRLRGGLVTPLFPLDEQIRFCLLKQYAQRTGVAVEEHALQQLAGRVSGDGRLLLGLVHRLTAVAQFQTGTLNWEQCWSAVMDLVQAAQPVVRLADIERAVCGIFRLEPDSLQSKSKIRSVSQPRMLAMFLARKYTPAAYKEIGDYFGSRRHSTVISAEKTVETWLSENVELDGNRHLTVRDAIRNVEAQLHVG
jgi:chromosomal replication initiator protein